MTKELKELRVHFTDESYVDVDFGEPMPNSVIGKVIQGLELCPDRPIDLGPPSSCQT